MGEDVVGESEYQVRDVMSTPVFKSLPVMSVKEAARIMIDNRIGSIVVVNERDVLLGIVTRTDIIREVVAKGRDPEATRIGDIMTRNPYFVYTDDPLEKAAEIMGAYGIGHLPVLDPESRRPVGMVSLRDIVKLAPDYIKLIYSLKKEIDVIERSTGSSEPEEG